MKIRMFSTHSMKYIWYSPQKSKYLLYLWFLFVGYLPSRLPTSCLTMAPRFDTLAKSESLHRKPLLEINGTGKVYNNQRLYKYRYTQNLNWIIDLLR